ncbi:MULTISPECIES: hypothetical protein [unclassified Sporosarcina]|uniref:hypothetical protein n=1 Tax=unclassified Sporosarcina TaxID=2647733 RepID=UPI003159CD91
MLWGTILLWIVGLLILYVVIFAAVKDGIDRSEVGQLIKTKYGVSAEIVSVSDDEIEKELEDEFNKK